MMRTDIHSVSMLEGDKIKVEHQPGMMVLPEVMLAVCEDGIPRQYIRMSVDQLDRLILEATACRREIDEKNGVPQ